MKTLVLRCILMAFIITSAAAGAVAGQSGVARHDNVLLGFHFVPDHADETAKALPHIDRSGLAPGFWDYCAHMPEDLRYVSYADFWYWWYTLERYKGDEKGLEEFDKIVDACLSRGMKVKVDLAYSSFWTADHDWAKDADMVYGPNDMDDWIHLCDLLGRRYSGRVALWMLQGEANLSIYWPGRGMDWVHEIYKNGYKAFKRADPDVLVSISGTNPGNGAPDMWGGISNPDSITRWLKENILACPGYFDSIPMNHFADVKGADPYGSMAKYYDTIHGFMDQAGVKDAEVDSGESSVQWTQNKDELPDGPPPTSMADLDPEKSPLSVMKQAWQMNESQGTFFDRGGNKFMWWATEFAPGYPWLWRWGFRKYEDHWGAWDASYKIPGTNIVYKHETPDGKTIDLRKAWPDPASVYYPVWEVYKFWQQCTPPGAEAVRLPMEVTGNTSRVLKIATWLQAADKCVLLMQADKQTPAAIDLDLSKTSWADGDSLTVSIRNESIDYAYGTRKTVAERSIESAVSNGRLRFDMPSFAGFTTVAIARKSPALAAEFLSQAVLGEPEVARETKGVVTIRNTGTAKWSKRRVKVGLFSVAAFADAKQAVWSLPHDVEPGQSVAVDLGLPAASAAKVECYTLRLREGGKWFGPTYSFTIRVSDPDAPRRFLAFREVGKIRLKWFTPTRGDVSSYEIYRADGFEQPSSLLKTVKGTEYVDTDVTPDRAYYYHVVPIGRDGKPGRRSNEDNAKAISQPKLYDAEIVSHDIPASMTGGESIPVTITVKNTGSRAWDLSDPAKTSFRLKSMALWGSKNEAILPALEIEDRSQVRPGETVSFHFTYAAPKPGAFENHWITEMTVNGGTRAYFGTPLLAETRITGGR